MHYYIDGYNILFRVLRAGGDLKKQRDLFILELNEKVRLLNLDVTIVFDAHYQPGEGSRTLFDALEIFYTDEGESADDYILKRLKTCSKPKQETLITSDNRLAWAARLCLVKTEGVNEFLAWLNKRYSSRLAKDDDKTLRLKHLSKLNVVSEEHAVEEIQPPSPGKSAIESFDYYLYRFEKEFRETAAKEPKREKIKPNTPSKSRKKRDIPVTENTQEPDMDRWLRIFDQKKDDKTDFL